MHLRLLSLVDYPHRHLEVCSQLTGLCSRLTRAFRQSLLVPLHLPGFTLFAVPAFWHPWLQSVVAIRHKLRTDASPSSSTQTACLRNAASSSCRTCRRDGRTPRVEFGCLIQCGQRPNRSSIARHRYNSHPMAGWKVLAGHCGFPRRDVQGFYATSCHRMCLHQHPVPRWNSFR